MQPFESLPLSARLRWYAAGFFASATIWWALLEAAAREALR